MARGNIEIVDFGPFLDGSDKEGVANAILRSFQEIGFVYLLNHGLPQGKIDEMFAWSKRFFDMSMEDKQKSPHPPSGSHHRGYSAPGVENVKRHGYSDDEIARQDGKGPHDVKESFDCGRENDDLMPNIWPPEGVIPGFKEGCLDFFTTCYQLELAIFRALALGFKLPEDYFSNFHTDPDNQLRLLHYPSVSVESLAKEEISLIGAHSDFASITILFQDDAGGLEVEDPHNPGTFILAPPVPGAAIVNVGDFLMRWSNDTVRSTVHRVRAPPHLPVDGMTRERYSIPYFCGADFDTIIDCVPGTFSEERPKRYEPISPKEYVLKRLAANY